MEKIIGVYKTKPTECLKIVKTLVQLQILKQAF